MLSQRSPSRPAKLWRLAVSGSSVTTCGVREGVGLEAAPAVSGERDWSAEPAELKYAEDI